MNYMENDQFKILLDKLDDHGTKLDALHGDFREFKGSTEVKVANLKEQADSDRKWGRIQTIVVVPVVAALHVLAGKLGVIK